MRRAVTTIIIFLIFAISFVSNATYGQNLPNSNSLFVIHFDEGFKNTLVLVKGQNPDTIFFKEILNSDNQFGFAGSLKLKKNRQYFLVLREKQYPLKVDSTNFAYVRLIKNELIIKYSNRKKLYE